MARKSRRSSSSAATKTAGPPKSKYAKVSGAEVFGAVNYLNRASRYIVLINSIEEGENHNNILFVQNNMRILKVIKGGSLSHDYDKRKNGEPVELDPHPVGDEVVDKIMSNNIVFGSNLKRLAMTVGDLTQEDFDNESYEGEIIEDMVNAEQPLAGRVVEIRAVQVVKKAQRDKDEEDLTNEDCYTRVDYVELLQGEDITEELDAEVIEEYQIDTSEPDEGDDAAEE
jgi:hypothetical protein